ncbi:hypothetical protein GQX74_004492 [Glossina fuscipes]|nr:hypothetical protein GQX74_004492 [Glossina fuscipes]
MNEITEMIFTRQTFVGTHEKRVTGKNMQKRQKKTEKKLNKKQKLTTTSDKIFLAIYNNREHFSCPAYIFAHDAFGNLRDAFDSE